MIEFVYGLHCGDVIFYVGRCNNLQRRLKEHQKDDNPSGTLKQRTIYQLNQEGIPFSIKVLQSGTAMNLQGVEDTWITNLRAEGMPLTNTRSGDSPLLTFEREKVLPWSIELFENAKWEKTPKCKSGEVSTEIKGTEFFRMGQRKLRIWHCEYGEWAIGGVNMKDRYTNAINKLTPGTKEHQFLLEQCCQVKRFRR